MRMYQWYSICDNGLGRREVTLQRYDHSLVGSVSAPELWGVWCSTTGLGTGASITFSGHSRPDRVRLNTLSPAMNAS